MTTVFFFTYGGLMWVAGFAIGRATSNERR